MLCQNLKSPLSFRAISCGFVRHHSSHWTSNKFQHMFAPGDGHSYICNAFLNVVLTTFPDVSTICMKNWEVPGHCPLQVLEGPRVFFVRFRATSCAL